MIAIFPEIVSCATKGDLETLGILARRYFARSETFAPRTDIAAMLNCCGIRTERVPMDGKAALIAKDEHGAFDILAIIAKHTEPHAERFLLAHLLGHFMLHIQPQIAAGQDIINGFRENRCPLDRYVTQNSSRAGLTPDEVRDRDADRFAAALLLPAPMLRRAMEKIDNTGRLASFFGVTAACIAARQQELGLIPVEPRNFIDAERHLQNSIVPERTTKLADQELQISIENQVSRKNPIGKAFAAHSYDQTRQSTLATPLKSRPTKPILSAEPKTTPATVKSTTAKAPAPPPKPVPVENEVSSEAINSGRGLARLREIARQMDKTVP